MTSWKISESLVDQVNVPVYCRLSSLYHPLLVHQAAPWQRNKGKEGNYHLFILPSWELTYSLPADTFESMSVRTSKSGRCTRSLEGCNLLFLVSARQSMSLQNVMQNSKKKQIWFPKKQTTSLFEKIRCSVYKTLVQPFCCSLLDPP